MVLLSLLGACSLPDYTAVRDWARTASIAADYAPAAPGAATGSAGRADAPAASAPRPADPVEPSASGLPGVAAAPPSAAPAVAEAHPAAPVAPGREAEGIRAMQEALSVTLAALATIASDGILPYREDPFAAALVPQAAAADPAGGEAVATLGGWLREATITNLRAPQTRDAITALDPTVQALTAALSGSVARMAAGEAEDRAKAAERAAGLEARAHDPAMRLALRDMAALRDQAFADRAAARERYLAVLARIAEGHALMREQAKRITQEESIRRIRAAEDQLRRAAALLPPLLPPAPAGPAAGSGPDRRAR